MGFGYAVLHKLILSLYLNIGDQLHCHTLEHGHRPILINERTSVSA